MSLYFLKKKQDVFFKKIKHNYLFFVSRMKLLQSRS